jgi:hypothetical protein
MIFEYLSFIYNIFSYSLTIAFFLFIYKYLYDQCIVEKIKETNINSNNKKVIKIIDNKISLSLIYFFLLFLLYLFLDFKSLLCIVITFVILFSLLVNKIDNTIINFSIIDNTNIMLKVWSIFSNVMNIIFLAMSPIYKYIEKNKKVNKIIINDTIKNITKNTSYSEIINFMFEENNLIDEKKEINYSNTLNLFDNINQLQKLLNDEFITNSSSFNKINLGINDVEKYLLLDKSNKKKLKKKKSNLITRNNVSLTPNLDLLDENKLVIKEDDILLETNLDNNYKNK